MVREATFWRIADLLTQSQVLHRHDHTLGARVLLRSAFETFALLVYLNLKMEAVLEGRLDFHEFGDTTARLSGGMKNEPKPSPFPTAVNVLTMFEKAEKRYPGLIEMFDELSESAHPNYYGLVWGYSKVDHAAFESNFSNRWKELYAQRHEPQMRVLMTVYEHEYNAIWHELMTELETWTVANDAILESTRKDIAPT